MDPFQQSSAAESLGVMCVSRGPRRRLLERQTSARAVDLGVVCSSRGPVLEPYIDETPNFFEGNAPRDSLKCPASAKLLVRECANRLFRGECAGGRAG